MTDVELEAFKQLVVSIIKDLAPKDTGNLAYNAIRVERTAPNEYRIYVSVEGEHKPRALDGIAPYQVYVNDRVTLVNGKRNPNYKWWESAVDLAVEEAAKHFNGEIQ